ncbi:hypothetical protein ROZALSC1DRAFT_28090 [Rozella allomycis CSF55]|uniref:UBC core domain-containing protein n=1 Tax=Rozella allomycis (strain CSF55) TaxID=988480 RepID=A0A4P9YLN7_ROZAC|nr:hypothetical protein ROZALSC1DRAFT_28090 [Rozella allomycis CSF55]
MLYSDGVFELEVIFEERFDSIAPHVRYMTIPFHPNSNTNSLIQLVNPDTGQLTCSMLSENNWLEGTSMSFLLSELSRLLHEPELEYSCNNEALQLFLESPHYYNQLAGDCAVMSVRAREKELNDANIIIKQVDQIIRKEKKIMISYTDYYKSWIMLATSSNNSPESHECITDTKAVMDSLIQSVWNKKARNISKKQSKKENDTQISKSRSLKDDIMITKNNQPLGELKNLEVMNISNILKDSLKNLQTATSQISLKSLSKSQLLSNDNVNLEETNDEHKKDEEDDLEREVDELIEWTSSLDLQTI